MSSRKTPLKQAKRRKHGQGAATPSQPDSNASEESEELVGVPRGMVEAYHALVAERQALLSPIDATGVYNMRIDGERERLAVDIWRADFSTSMVELRDCNPQLVKVLRAQISNKSDVTEVSQAVTERHIDGILLDMVRAQNMFHIPLLTAATSLMCEVNKTSREYHDLISGFHMGAALSERWVTEFLKTANVCRPAMSQATILGVICCCFDNLTMKIDYSSYSTEGETGRQLDMTNWFSLRLPLHLAPNFDAQATCACCSPPPSPI